MNTKKQQIHSIYVSNLKFTLNEGDILGLFKKYGYIKSIKMLKEGKENKFKGVAFVDMVNAENAKKAIEALNGSEKFGRTLKVSLANNQNFKSSDSMPFKPEVSKNLERNMTKKNKRLNSKTGLSVLFSNTRQVK